MHFEIYKSYTELHNLKHKKIYEMLEEADQKKLEKNWILSFYNL